MTFLCSLIRRMVSAVSRRWFALCHAGAFRSCGKGSHLRPPFRLDGARYISLADQVTVQEGGWLYCCPDQTGAGLSIGSGSVLGYNNHVTAVRQVTIGCNVLTANNVFISDNVHGYEDVRVPIMQQPVRFKGAVSVGDGSWIGENACIIGARVGQHCVIGANAVVTQDIPDFSVAVGIPARVIRRYDHKVAAWVKVEA